MTLIQKIQITAALALFTACTGCAQPAKSPKKDLVQCYAAALQPVVGEVYDAVELTHDLVAGKASLAAVLANLQVAEAEAKALDARIKACTAPPAALPTGTAG